jgi:hypothetical protein
MKNLTYLLSLISLSVLTLSPVSAATREAYVTVDGMVCAYCAAGLLDLFRAQSEVSDMQVDIDNALLRIEFNQGQEFSRDRAYRLIYDAGYDMAWFYLSDVSRDEAAGKLADLRSAALPSVPSSVLIHDAGDALYLRLTFPDTDKGAWRAELERNDAALNELRDLGGLPEWWQPIINRRSRGFTWNGLDGFETQVVTDRNERLWYVKAIRQ